MLIPIIERRLAFFPRVDHITITIERAVPPRVPNPTKLDLDRCPATFRCYSCLVRWGKKHLGGEVLVKRICRMCYPYMDERAVAGLIAWDTKHGFRVE